MQASSARSPKPVSEGKRCQLLPPSGNRLNWKEHRLIGALDGLRIAVETWVTAAHLAASPCEGLVGGVAPSWEIKIL